MATTQAVRRPPRMNEREDGTRTVSTKQREQAIRQARVARGR